MPADRPTDTNRLLALEQELLRVRKSGGIDQPSQAQSFDTDPAPTRNRLLSLANELLNYQNLAERLRSRTTADPDSPSEETQSMSNDDFSVANQLLDLERSLLKHRGNGSNGATDRNQNESRAYDFDKPIVFRDPTAITMGVDGEMVTNQFMELERSLLAHKTDSPPGKPRKAAPETVTAMAFDYDEAIQLQYNSNAFQTDDHATPFNYDYEVTAQSYYPESYAAALMDDRTSPEAFGLQDEPAAFEVEAFADRGTTQSATYPIATPPNAAIPVQATVVPASEAIAQSVYSDAYDSPSSSSNAFAEDSFGFAASDDIADAQAFAADLQAILSGAKTYEPETKQTIPTHPSSPSSPPPPAPEPTTPTPTPLSQSHAIFDQITHNMAYANAFDLGNISMEQRFDEFDRVLDKEENQASRTIQPAAQSPIDVKSRALELDDHDITRDLALMQTDILETHAVEMGKKEFDAFTANPVTFFGKKVLKIASIPVNTTGATLKKVSVQVQEADNSPKLITETIDLYTLPPASWKHSLYLVEKPSEFFFDTIKQSGSTQFDTYYLPWQSGKAYMMTLGNDANYFLTAQVNGCCVMIGGDRANPVIIHANYASPRLTPDEDMSKMTHQQMLDAYKTHQFKQYTRFYGNLAHQFVDDGTLDSTKPIAIFDPEFYLSRGGFATVFGIKRNGEWTFYFNLNKGTGNVTAELWPAVVGRMP